MNSSEPVAHSWAGIQYASEHDRQSPGPLHTLHPQLGLLQACI